MKNYRYEDYSAIKNRKPCVVNADIVRAAKNQSDIANWHNNIEIQLCVEGTGYVITDSRRAELVKNDIIVVNSNSIHYTGTDDYLKYHCVIIDTDFSLNAGIDTANMLFNERCNSPKMQKYIIDLVKAYNDKDNTCYLAELQIKTLKILIELKREHMQDSAVDKSNYKGFDEVKNTIIYIKNNYREKITLDELSKVVYVDKYSLTRKFRQITGTTIINYINNYRCEAAKRLIQNGEAVNNAARLCGFENISFFTKTFKKQTGKLPSYYKNGGKG